LFGWRSVWGSYACLINNWPCTVVLVLPSPFLEWLIKGATSTESFPATHTMHPHTALFASFVYQVSTAVAMNILDKYLMTLP
jgi:hypothetical protein